MKKFFLLILSLFCLLSFCVACDSSGNNEDTANQTMNVSLSSKSFDYDGSEHCLVVEGDLPEFATIEWQNNSLTDVGKVIVFANVKCRGYNEVNLKATLTVLGKDVSSDVELVDADLDVVYGEEYSFALNNQDLLPDGYSLTENYIDITSGEVYAEKPNFGGEFRYVLQISAPGYNTKVMYGDLSITRPLVQTVEITNLPTLAIPKYSGKAALLPGMTWVPEAEGSPKGHADVEFIYSSSNEGRLKFVDGAFVALDNPGECKVTVSIKGTTISKTYTFVVSDTSFFYDDFEDESKILYKEEYVSFKNSQNVSEFFYDKDGQPVMIPKYKKVLLNTDGSLLLDADGNPKFESVNASYYHAYSSVGSISEIAEVNGNRVMRVYGYESFSPYYSYFNIDAQPTGGWTAGTYRMEIDVTGDYAFVFYWSKDGTNYVLTGAADGVLSNFEAVINDGKIEIEFKLTDSDIGVNSNFINFSQMSRAEFDYTIDNVTVYKIK